jgi:hypothetical protein
MSVTISAWKRCSVRLYLQLLVGGSMSYLRYLCLFTHSGVQRILCCVFALFFFVLYNLCCQFLWIILFWLPLVFSNIYVCVRVSIFSFYDFDIWSWNWYDSVVCFVLNWYDSVVCFVLNWYDSVVCFVLNWYDSVVCFGLRFIIIMTIQKNVGPYFVISYFNIKPLICEYQSLKMFNKTIIIRISVCHRVSILNDLVMNQFRRYRYSYI